MKTKTIKTYKFPELSESAKEKAREWMRNDEGMLVQWECETDIPQFLSEKWGNDPDYLKTHPDNIPTLPDIGLMAEYKDCSYEIGSYSGSDHITPKTIWIDDMKTFLDWLGWDRRRWFTQWLINGWVDLYISGKTGRYASSRVTVEFDILDYPESFNDTQYNQLYERLEELCQEIEEEINHLLQRYVRSMQKTIEWLYSDESIDEMIIMNEYDFTEEGSRKVYL